MIGLSVLGAEVLAAIVHREDFREWAGQAVIARRALQGLPLRDGEIQMMQMLTATALPLVTAVGVIWLLNGVTYQGGQQYIHLRVKQGGTDTAWTAPVWLEPLATTPPPSGGQPVNGRPMLGQPLCEVRLDVRVCQGLMASTRAVLFVTPGCAAESLTILCLGLRVDDERERPFKASMINSSQDAPPRGEDSRFGRPNAIYNTSS